MLSFRAAGSLGRSRKAREISRAFISGVKCSFLRPRSAHRLSWFIGRSSAFVEIDAESGFDKGTLALGAAMRLTQGHSVR